MGDLHSPNPTENGGPPHPLHPVLDTLIPFSSTSKRHRRPSVRLGEIGDQSAASGSYDPSVRRPKFSKFLPTSTAVVASKPSTKPRVTGLTAVRRARTNWTSMIDNGLDSEIIADLKLNGGEEAREDEYVDDSESPSNLNDRPSARARVSNEGEEHSEEGCTVWTGGIKPWLEGLGLGRYTSIFEIHEVDDEVLPLLTLEDLRDMGINAVGSRRKMYYAIHKLNRSKDSRERFAS